ncbi:DUF2971 domain-containing protein [Citricoccus sp. CH26A]
MNDASELTYAASLIDGIVKEAYQSLDDDRIHRLVPYHSGIANGFGQGARPFIACLCEKGDLLSQWRGYGVDTAPVSLGMSLLQMNYPDGLPPRTILRKVIYSRDQQHRSVKWITESWFQIIASVLDRTKGASIGEWFRPLAIQELQQALAVHHLCFKHPSFEEEQEWRLIRVVDVEEDSRLRDGRRQEVEGVAQKRTDKAGSETPEPATDGSGAPNDIVDVRFRQSSLGLVPYVEIPLLDTEGNFDGRLPLWQVIQGPTSHPELALDSLRMYLNSCGYGEPTEVLPSDIPLRW